MALAATTSSTLSLSSSSAIIDGKAPPRQSTAPCISLPTLSPPPAVQSQNRLLKTTATYCRKAARNVVAMATGEAIAISEAPPEAPAADVAASTELPEIVKTVQEAWDKVDDKYAVSSLAVAGVVALWGTTGMISAIDKLPLLPGVLELVGIGYTGWFAYKNLVYKPDREALVKKIKETYKEVIGSS